MASVPSWGQPAGQGDLEDFWRALGRPFPPLPPHLPCAYPTLPCCGMLPSPSLSLFAQPVWRPPGEEAAGRAWRARAGGAGTAGRAASPAALKAWLARHPQQPYPSKGDKAALALASSMSLAQVSTWFANARRRLKKESLSRPVQPDDHPEEEEEENAAAAPEDRPRTPPRAPRRLWSPAEMVAARPPGGPRRPPDGHPPGAS